MVSKPVFSNTRTSISDSGALAKMVMVLFERWELSRSDQAVLLGLGANSSEILAKYGKVTPLTMSRDQCDRMRHLLSIHGSLRTLFPRNRDLAYRWMTSPNKAFENLSPTEVVNVWGFAGLLRLCAYLERQCGR